jgi:hypothetical protein
MAWKSTNDCLIVTFSCGANGRLRRAEVSHIIHRDARRGVRLAGVHANPIGQAT